MRTYVPLIIGIFTLMILPSFAVMIPPVEGDQSEPFSGGYKWTDGKEPAPRIDVGWINVKTDPDAKGLDTQQWNALIRVDIGFDFTYYGSTYDRIYVSTYGAMSFTESDPDAFRNYYNYKIPRQNEPVGLMAVYWTWDSCYSRNNDRLFTLKTEIFGEKAFVVEWNAQQGGRYQAILFEGGMIKFQYQSTYSSYNVGEYCIIGIESPDSTNGVPYTNYQSRSTDLFNLPFAIAFTKDDMSVESISLENGDGTRGDKVYAGSKDYVFQTRVKHSRSEDSISFVTMTLGSLFNQENIRFTYFHSNGTFIQNTGYEHALLDTGSCNSLKASSRSIVISFQVDFKLEYPSEEPRNVSVFATGKSSIPALADGGELYEIENDLEWSGDDLIVIQRTGDERYLRQDDYIAPEEMIEFTGIQITYENSDIQPRYSLIWFEVTDNFNAQKTAYIPQGSYLSLTWTMADYTTSMRWTFHAAGVNNSNKLGQDFIFSLNIDAQPPSIRNFDEDWSLAFYPEGDEGEVSNITNMDTILMKWGRGDDGGSGIGGYIVEANGPDYNFMETVDEEDGRIFTLGSGIGDELPEGRLNISVSPQDKVGNIGEPVYQELIVDKSGPTFELISPDPGEWLMNNNPNIDVFVYDDLSGVEGSTLFFRSSKNNGITWSQWESFQVFGREYSFEKTIRPSLSEGRENLLEMKGEDFAGSGLTVSEAYNLWVDSHSPSIRMDSPEVDRNGTMVGWLSADNDPLRIKVHDRFGSGIDPNRISYRYSRDGGETFSSNIPLEGEPINNTQGIPEYTFLINKEWDEGADNLLVIEAYDRVGRNSTETFRIRVDVTPEVEMILPIPGKQYLDNESITFSVDVEDADGEEDLAITWTSSIDQIIGTEAFFSAKLSPGQHVITVTVEDGVHSVKRTISLNVEESLMLDPAYRDRDGDGMNDSYEIEMELDPDTKDADLDQDGDGYSNIEEMYAGTDPNDKQSYPGSELIEEETSILPFIILGVGLVLFLTFFVILLLEVRRGQKAQFAQPPMYSAPAAAPAPSLPPPGGSGEGQIDRYPQPQALPPARPNN